MIVKLTRRTIFHSKGCGFWGALINSPILSTEKHFTPKTKKLDKLRSCHVVTVVTDSNKDMRTVAWFMDVVEKLWFPVGFRRLRKMLCSVIRDQFFYRHCFLSRTKSENHLMKMSFEYESCCRCLIARVDTKEEKTFLNNPQEMEGKKC